jgi:alpha-N-arabinofuranosidase
MTKYTNPIIPGFHPDPSICRVGADYYLATSSFDYFPGIPVFHSRDLIHWKPIGHAIDRSSVIDLSTATTFGGLWAPTIRYHNGWFYLTCTNMSGQGHFIVKTQDPAQGWSDPIWISIETDWSFDPSLFFDDDGSVYFTYFTKDGIMQALIDPAAAKLITAPRRIADSMNGFTAEGPHLYKIKNYYYLLTANGGTEYGHMCSLARADNPWGPFTPCPHNPILSHRSLHSPIQITGHGDLFQDQNQNWWIVFLAARPVGYQPAHHLGRETFLAPAQWTDDDWITVGDHGRVQIAMDAPLPPTQPAEIIPARDDFASTEFDHCWNFIRNPDPSCWSLSERIGHLRLNGLPGTLNDTAPIAFVGRRQEHFNIRIAAQIEFTPQTDKDEAGLCIRMNEGHHYEIFKTIRGNEPVIVVRRSIGSLRVETASIRLSASQSAHASVLSIIADAEWYRLGIMDGGTFSEIDKAETRYLSTEVARGFTGVYFGMYATGNGAPSSAPADFDWFDYIPVLT